MPDAKIIALAGAGGDLGQRIARALVARGATVRALVRRHPHADQRRQIEGTGAVLVEADPADPAEMSLACAGAACVVSALSGVRSVMIDRQSVLLEGAVKAGVPRFIPSDYSADFTKTRPGDNRNFDLRREFMERADRASIKVTSILNGAFMDMLGAEMPIIQRKIHRVLYWHDADQPLDFTTKDDVAGLCRRSRDGRDHTAHSAYCRRRRERPRDCARHDRREQRTLWPALGREHRHARRHDRDSQDHRARSGGHVPAVARHAIHAAISSAAEESSRPWTMHAIPN